MSRASCWVTCWSGTSGGSTALLSADLFGAFLVVIGIALVTILGEAARYALLRLE